MECKVLVFGDKTSTGSFLNKVDSNYKDYCENDGINFKTYSINTSSKINFKLIAMNKFEILDQNEIESLILDVWMYSRFFNSFILLVDSESYFINILNITKCLKSIFKDHLLTNLYLCFMNFEKTNCHIKKFQIDLIESIVGSCFETKKFAIGNDTEVNGLMRNISESKKKIFKYEIVSEKLNDNLNHYFSMHDKIKNETNNSTNDLAELFHNKLKIEESIIATKISDSDHINTNKSQTNESNENETKIEKLIDHSQQIDPYSSNEISSKAATINNENQINIENTKSECKEEITETTVLNNNSVNEKIFLVLGESGSGKSTFINYIANYFEGNINFDEISADLNKLKIAIDEANWSSNIIKRFSTCKTEKNIYDKTKSQTFICNAYDFFDKSNGQTIKLIDTPGVNDTEGNINDTANYEKIKDACLKQSKLNGVIFITNGSKCRNDINIRNLIEFITQLLPDNFKSIMLVATNSSDSSNNFNLKLVDQVVKLDNIFFMQNSFFNWDKDKIYTEKSLKLFKMDWDDSVTTIRSILNVLAYAEPISTDVFKKINSQEMIIASKIKKVLVKNLKDLFVSYADQQFYYQKLINIFNEMKKNTNTKNSYCIPAIQNGHHTTMHVSLPDNSSIYKHQNYELQLCEAKEKQKQQQLDILKTEGEIDKILNEIEKECSSLRKLNKSLNFAEKFGSDYQILCGIITDKNKSLFKSYLSKLEYSLGFSNKKL